MTLARIVEPPHVTTSAITPAATGAITTVKQFLMRGLATACQACVVGLSLTRGGRHRRSRNWWRNPRPAPNALATASGVR
jgi:hypothetical protein